MSRVEIDGVGVRYGSGAHSFQAVESADLDIESGSVMGLVGESGSGKSTLARAIVGLVPISSGRIAFDGRDAGRTARRRRAHGQRVQMIFQDPHASLDPRMTIEESLGEAVASVGRTAAPARRTEAARLLELVGLDPRLGRVRPAQLSGGQAQRVAIARAVAARPTVLVADEITSALDVSVQGAVLNLIRSVQAELGFTMLFISHNLALVRYLSTSVAVMYAGHIVEVGETRAVTDRPTHPYTQTLLDAVPNLRASGDPTAVPVDGDPVDPHEPPSGCAFHPRCPVGPRNDPERAICGTEDPGADAADRPHRAACFFPLGSVTAPKALQS